MEEEKSEEAGGKAAPEARYAQADAEYEEPSYGAPARRRDRCDAPAPKHNSDAGGEKSRGGRQGQVRGSCGRNMRRRQTSESRRACEWCVARAHNERPADASARLWPWAAGLKRAGGESGAHEACPVVSRVGSIEAAALSVMLQCMTANWSCGS